MGMLIRKQRGMYGVTKIGRLSVIVFIVAMSAALIDTIWSVYLDEFFHDVSKIGFFSSFLTLLGFLSFFVTVPLIERSNKSKLYAISLFLFGISYILFAINTDFYILVLLSCLVTVLGTLRITSFGIIVRDSSKEKQLSRNEGLIYTFANTAWVVGPLLAGYASDVIGIRKVFMLSAIFVFVAFFLFKMSRINDANIKKKADYNVFKNFKEYFANKDRTLSYMVSGGISIWWALIYLYMPLYMIRNALSKTEIGYFLFAIAVPLILFEYKFSKIASSKGYRKTFATGYFILFICAASCFLFVNNIYLVLSILVLGSIGNAFLEPTTEAYFFEILNGKEEENKFYGPYNTTIDAGLFIGKLIPATVLLFLPFKYIFLVLSLLMIILVIVSLKCREIVFDKKD